MEFRLLGYLTIKMKYYSFFFQTGDYIEQKYKQTKIKQKRTKCNFICRWVLMRTDFNLVIKQSKLSNCRYLSLIIQTQKYTKFSIVKVLSKQYRNKTEVQIFLEVLFKCYFHIELELRCYIHCVLTNDQPGMAHSWSSWSRSTVPLHSLSLYSYMLRL